MEKEFFALGVDLHQEQLRALIYATIVIKSQSYKKIDIIKERIVQFVKPLLKRKTIRNKIKKEQGLLTVLHYPQFKSSYVHLFGEEDFERLTESSYKPVPG
jgi:hypothetical protein